MKEFLPKILWGACLALTAAVCAFCGKQRPSLECDTARMYAMIEALASDSLAGRRAESGNDLRAARYLAGELADAGVGALWNDEMAVPFDMEGVSERRGMHRSLGGEWSGSSCNLVTVVRSGYPDAEKVLLGAHFDHMGRFKADKGRMWRAGDVLLGANDNASGTAAVVEIARLLAPYAGDFKRDLVVALFGAEEMGAVGSRHMERMLRDSSVRVGHMVNLEMLGRMRGDTLELQGGAFSPLDEVIGRTPRPDSLIVYSRRDRVSVGSDHVWFAKNMIPVSFFITTDLSTLHKPVDTPESLDMQGMRRAVDYIAAYVYTLLTADELPQWSPERPSSLK